MCAVVHQLAIEPGVNRVNEYAASTNDLMG